MSESCCGQWVLHVKATVNQGILVEGSVIVLQVSAADACSPACHRQELLDAPIPVQSKPCRSAGSYSYAGQSHPMRY